MFHVKHAPLEPAPEMTAAAADWPLTYVSRETSAGHVLGAGVTQVHLVCRECDQSVVCLSPDTAALGRGYLQAGYVVTVAGMTAHVIAHIRQRHTDSVPAP